MTFPLVPTVLIISLCGSIFAASLAFFLTRNIKAVVVAGLVTFAAGDCFICRAFSNWLRLIKVWFGERL